IGHGRRADRGLSFAAGIGDASVGGEGSGRRHGVDRIPDGGAGELPRIPRDLMSLVILGLGLGHETQPLKTLARSRRRTLMTLSTAARQHMTTVRIAVAITRFGVSSTLRFALFIAARAPIESSPPNTNPTT